MLLRPVNVVLNFNRHPDHIRITGKMEGSWGLVATAVWGGSYSLSMNPLTSTWFADARAPKAEEKELVRDEPHMNSLTARWSKWISS